MLCFIFLFVCLECCSRTLYFVFSLSRSRAKVLTTAGDLRKPKRNSLVKDRNRYLFIYFFIFLHPFPNRYRTPPSLAHCHISIALKEKYIISHNKKINLCGQTRLMTPRTRTQSLVPFYFQPEYPGSFFH